MHLPGKIEKYLPAASQIGGIASLALHLSSESSQLGGFVIKTVTDIREALDQYAGKWEPVSL